MNKYGHNKKPSPARHKFKPGNSAACSPASASAAPIDIARKPASAARLFSEAASASSSERPHCRFAFFAAAARPTLPWSQMVGDDLFSNFRRFIDHLAREQAESGPLNRPGSVRSPPAAVALFCGLRVAALHPPAAKWSVTMCFLTFVIASTILPVRSWSLGL